MMFADAVKFLRNRKGVAGLRGPFLLYYLRYTGAFVFYVFVAELQICICARSDACAYVVDIL